MRVRSLRNAVQQPLRFDASLLKIGDVSVIGHGKPAPRAARYKRVPRDVRFLANFHMSDAAWDGLLIPINLAFFFRNSALPSGPDSCVSAFYPSPAGATESLLPLEAWNGIVQANPILTPSKPTSRRCS